MQVQKVLNQIDSEALARDVLEFVKVQSETGREGAGSRCFADLLRRSGFEPVLDEVGPGRPNVYAVVRGQGGGPSLLLNGHTDTIPAGGCDPPERRGDWVIGRGAEDMKGGMAAMVHAAAALRRAGVRLAGDLWLTGVVGHEAPAGKKEGPRRLIEHLRSGGRQAGPRADAILIAEGPDAIWAASLGSTIWNVTITSGRGVIHTIKTPYAENPVRWLGKLLAEIEALEARFAAGPAHALCGREQLNIGIVRAGDYPNRLPTPVTVTGTWRWMPGKTHQQVRAQLQAICGRLAAESGLDFAVSFEAEREPFETPPDHPLVQALASAGETVTGAAPRIIGMALVGDANLYANDAGVPAVYYGPAHETAHSDHERVSISRLAQCAGVYALTAMRYCGVADEK
jgi:succinyl-diaminopimelate desuccinylase